MTGAICKDEQGYFRVNAKNGVILATGGFDANPQLLKTWCRPEDIANCASWCPNLGTTGDGQLAGLAVGAQMDPLPAAIMNFDFGSPESFYSSNWGITAPRRCPSRLAPTPSPLRLTTAKTAGALPLPTRFLPPPSWKR